MTFEHNEQDNTSKSTLAEKAFAKKLVESTPPNAIEALTLSKNSWSNRHSRPEHRNKYRRLIYLIHAWIKKGGPCYLGGSKVRNWSLWSTDIEFLQVKHHQQARESLGTEVGVSAYVEGGEARSSLGWSSCDPPHQVDVPKMRVVRYPKGGEPW